MKLLFGSGIDPFHKNFFKGSPSASAVNRTVSTASAAGFVKMIGSISVLSKKASVQCHYQRLASCHPHTLCL